MSAKDTTPYVYEFGSTKIYYIAGPMRGYPEFNFPEFNETAEFLRNQGHYVFNPAEHDVENGFDPTGLKGTTEELRLLKFDLRAALAVDVKFICEWATHIYMLSGWSNSKGAKAERMLGLALGLTIEGAAA